MPIDLNPSDALVALLLAGQQAKAKLANFRGGGVVNKPWGLHAPNAAPTLPHSDDLDELVIVKLTANNDNGGEQYDAKIFFLNPDSDFVGDLDDEDLGELPAASDAVAWNLGAFGNAGYSLNVAAAKPMAGMIIGQMDDGRYLVAVFGGGFGGTIPVALTIDGGSNGDGVTAVTYTYTATDLTGTTTYGTLLSPWRVLIYALVTPADRGLLYFEPDGTPKLATTNEIDAQLNCET